MIHEPDICSSCDHGWVEVHDGVRPCETCREPEYKRWLLGDVEPPEETTLPLQPDWNQVRKDLR